MPDFRRVVGLDGGSRWSWKTEDFVYGAGCDL
jgi:hypothetical protein